MHIRPTDPDDHDAIWSIIGPTIGAGETYALDPAMTKADALGYWLGEDKATYVALDDAGAIVGRLPGAFRHPDGGYVDALVMYRDLGEAA